MFVFLLISSIVQIIKEVGFFINWFCWTMPAIIIAIALGIAFNSLKAQQKKVGDVIFLNDRLMRFHWIAFMTATLLDVILLIITTIDYFKSDKMSVQDAIKQNKELQLKTTISVMSIIHTLAWNVVQFLMLMVFVKYGRPIEKDTQKLVQNHLLSV